MIVNGTLSSWQAISTLGCVSIIPLILTLPTFACEEFGTGTFLQVVYMTIIMGLFLLLYFKLYSKFNHRYIRNGGWQFLKICNSTANNRISF